MKNILLSIIILPSLLFAQIDNGDSLKFEIIKASINFLAKDTATYRNSKGKSAICNNGDYDCLKKFCIDSKLLNAETKVTEWKNLPSNSKEDLNKLTGKILNDLTTVDAYKKNRIKMPDFVNFKENITQLSNSLSSQNKEENPPDSIFKDNTLPIGDTPDSENGLTWVALVLSIFSLIGFIGILVMFSKEKAVRRKRNTELRESDKDLKNEINVLQKKLKEVTSNISLGINEKMNSLNLRLDIMENKNTISEDETRIHISAPKIKEEIVQLPISNIKYARYPDTPNGFTGNALKDEQNGELIFEIKILDNSANFSVTENIDAQAFALSDFKNYMSDACIFSNQPFRGCRINTVSKGTLIKSGIDWVIEEKAKIEFR